jgi:hypothetical protein
MDNVAKRGGLVRQQSDKKCHDYLTERLFNETSIVNLEGLVQSNSLPFYDIQEKQLILDIARQYQASGLLGSGGGIPARELSAIQTLLKGRTIDEADADMFEPPYTTFLEPKTAAEASAFNRTNISVALLTFHVHIDSPYRVTIHLISTSDVPFTFVMNPFVCPDDHLTRHNGDVHYFVKKLADEIHAISHVRPFRVNENFTVSYDVMFNRSVDTRGGGYHSDMGPDGYPYKFISLEYFMPDDILCASAELLLNYPVQPGGRLISEDIIRARYQDATARGERVSIRTAVKNGSFIAFPNDKNLHATPGFGSKYVAGHSDALSNVTRTVFGNMVRPPFRLEHSFKRNDPMSESPSASLEVSEEEDEAGEVTHRVEQFEGFSFVVPIEETQVNDINAPFGSGFDRRATVPVAPPASPAAEEETVDEWRIPRIDDGPNPPGTYPAYKNDRGTTIQYHTLIALDHPPDVENDRRIDAIDISNKLESTFVTEMSSTQIEAIIQDTLKIRRSFIRGSWTVSGSIDYLLAHSKPGFRALRMPNGWIYVDFIFVDNMDDALHTIGGGQSYASKQTIPKPPVVATIPDSIFSNVFVNDIYTLVQLRPSKLREYIQMENKFKRVAKQMRGGRKNKKSRNKNKKTKKRSKKQTRKRVN